MELLIEFSGMCMLVPDGNQLRVLMPHVHAHGGSARHVPRLFAEQDNVVGDDWQTVGPFPPFVQLKGYRLDLSGVGSGFNPRLPSELVHLTRCTGAKADRTAFGDASRVEAATLLNTGSAAGVRPGAEWELGSCKQQMPVACNWIISDVPGNELTLKLVPIAGGAPRTVRVKPDAQGQIRLYVYHTPNDEWPGSQHTQHLPPKVDHFGHFYSLSKQKPGHVPTRPGGPPAPPAIEESFDAPGAAFLGSRLTCIITVADPEP